LRASNLISDCHRKVSKNPFKRQRTKIEIQSWSTSSNQIELRYSREDLGETKQDSRSSWPRRCLVLTNKKIRHGYQTISHFAVRPGPG
jgi:hypothetical protein